MATTGKSIIKTQNTEGVRESFVGQSPAMNQLRELIQRIGRRNCTVLVHGESGSGKELVARQIHAHSNRADKTFVPVDCTTLKDTLFESQLFGHKKGAFTGAEQDTLGFFRAAEGGTLFLDEIGELALDVQAKLLRAIQERAVVPLGGIKPVSVDVRIICATHRDVKKMVRKGEFREDLFYRLNVVCLDVPSLRQRKDDIMLLADHFLAELAELYQEPLKSVAADALKAMEGYEWPGNIRELANAIEHSYIMTTSSELVVSDLPEQVRSAVKEPTAADGKKVSPLVDAERALIIRALQAADGNQTKAARMLQVERHRFYRMVKKYKLEAMTNATVDA